MCPVGRRGFGGGSPVGRGEGGGGAAVACKNQCANTSGLNLNSPSELTIRSRCTWSGMITKSEAVKWGSNSWSLRHSATICSPAGSNSCRLAPRSSRESMGHRPSTANVKKKNRRPVCISGNCMVKPPPPPGFGGGRPPHRRGVGAASPPCHRRGFGGRAPVGRSYCASGQTIGQAIAKPSPRRTYQKPVPAGIVMSVTRTATVLSVSGSYVLWV